MCNENHTFQARHCKGWVIFFLTMNQKINGKVYIKTVVSS